MKNAVLFVFTLCFALLLSSCSDGAITATDGDVPALRADDALTLTPDSYPEPLRGLRSICDGPAGASVCASKAPVNASPFGGPLFGLATAPNGDILVADASAGVLPAFSKAGVEAISLPGVTDVGPIGRASMWATRGGGADPTSDSGQALLRISPDDVLMVANLFEFEAAEDPDGAGVDSNPFDVQSLGGGVALVVDAGGNTLLRVDEEGSVEVVAVFPVEPVSTANIKSLAGCPSPAPFCGLPDMMPAEAVPTSVAIGPDGYYYVGELKGFPAPAGASNIWRVSPDASNAMCGLSPDCEKVYDGGFTSIIDVAFDQAGNLLVAELDEASWAAVEIFMAPTGGTINNCSSNGGACNEVATGIPILTAITVGKRGELWATRNALVPGGAEVVQIQ